MASHVHLHSIGLPSTRLSLSLYCLPPRPHSSLTLHGSLPLWRYNWRQSFQYTSAQALRPARSTHPPPNNDRSPLPSHCHSSSPSPTLILAQFVRQWRLGNATEIEKKKVFTLLILSFRQLRNKTHTQREREREKKHCFCHCYAA